MYQTGSTSGVVLGTSTIVGISQAGVLPNTSSSAMLSIVSYTIALTSALLLFGLVTARMIAAKNR
jgi:hypothetical protein